MICKELEQEIQNKGLTAPRVTPADIEANIVSEHYFNAAEAIWAIDKFEGMQGFGYEPTLKNDKEQEALSLITFCILILKNGFTVIGESACASPENFDAEIGKKAARENAINKIWPLMGYELKSKLSIES